MTQIIKHHVTVERRIFQLSIRSFLQPETIIVARHGHAFPHHHWLTMFGLPRQLSGILIVFLIARTSVSLVPIAIKPFGALIFLAVLNPLVRSRQRYRAAPRSLKMRSNMPLNFLKISR